MPLKVARTRQLLQDFDFRRLFVEELGWSNPPHALKPADAEAKGGIVFRRTPVAVLSAIHVFEIATPAGTIPDVKSRAAIHAAVSTLAAENLLIFTDTARTQSLWYWVKREAGKSRPRDHLYVKGQPGDLFLSKLAALVVDISELDAKGNIPLTEVARRLKNALDVERVTKAFFRDFQTQHLAFLELIEGIPDARDRRWYASVLLNRLMFVWFLQKKRFLDVGRNPSGDTDYLTRKFDASAAAKKERFFSHFLRDLFFEGFAKPESKRAPIGALPLGDIPYLNGGLFLPHGIEILSTAGHDVRTVVMQKLEGATDAELLRRCAEDERALVTLELDFANPLVYPPDRHAGVAVMRLPRKPTRANLDHLIATLVEALRRQSLAGQLWIVESGRIRIHLHEP